MAIAETQQLRMLERLRRAGKQPVTLRELRAGGIDFPAVVLSELELNGYAIERVHDHGRMIGVRAVILTVRVKPWVRAEARRSVQRAPPLFSSQFRSSGYRMVMSR